MSFNNINYQKILKYIKDSSKFYQNTAIPSIIAVTKTQSESVVLEALQAGIRSFGENRVQEALIKYKNIKPNHQQVKLHMIGPLQTNKVKKASEIFDFIHSLDSEKLAKKIAEEQIKQNLKPKIFIQINIGNEPQKSGILKENLTEFYNFSKKLGLDIVGTMCLPPFEEDSSKYFSEMNKLNQKLNLNEISMGMSSDYLNAIEFKSTYLRIGSNIFGQRI